MRLIVEPEVVRLAVLRCKEADLKEIKKAYQEMENAILSGVNHTQADINFHNSIAKASGNPIMERIIPVINNGIEGGYTKTKDNPESSEVVLKHHKQIMELSSTVMPMGQKKR